jgi:alanine dehydrogenase
LSLYVKNLGGVFMIIGIPKEIKDHENRVALAPSGVQALKNAGHQVLIETNAGLGSGFFDKDYEVAGAEIRGNAAGVWENAEMIMKVKEPLSSEYQYFKEGLILFTYLHLAAEKALTQALVEKKVVSIAYETIQLDNGNLPLLTPMSEVAGRMSVQIGAQLLEKPHGGKGVLLGGVPGVSPGRVAVIGGGIVGTNAVKMALGLGAQVTILDINLDRLRYLDDLYGGRLQTLVSNSYNLELATSKADLVIGAVLIPGARAPKLVTEQMVQEMSPGSVIVDVAIDQGGSIATIDRVTTHSNPTYLKHDVVHYAVANMPGAVPRTSTIALTNVTVPYALQIANLGYLQAINKNQSLSRGVNVIKGEVTHEAVAKSLNRAYTPLSQII